MAPVSYLYRGEMPYGAVMHRAYCEVYDVEQGTREYVIAEVAGRGESGAIQLAKVMARKYRSSLHSILSDSMRIGESGPVNVWPVWLPKPEQFLRDDGTIGGSVESLSELKH